MTDSISARRDAALEGIAAAGCAVDGCARPKRYRTMCDLHYNRLRKFGSILDPRRPEARFWPKVNRTPGCWEWTADTSPTGYGQFHLNGRTVRAHRYAYETFVGPIPNDLQLDHLCRNRACVNPDHLEPVTQRENVLRGISPAAHHATKTHCPQGHEYAGSNLHITKSGQRKCRACNRERVARYKARKRGGAV